MEDILKDAGVLLIEVTFAAACAWVVLFKADGTTIQDLAWWQWTVAAVLFIGISVKAIEKFRKRTDTIDG